MFEASLIVYGLLFGSECLKLDNTRGPYQSRGECVGRVVKLNHSTQCIASPPDKILEYKCEASY